VGRLESGCNWAGDPMGSAPAVPDPAARRGSSCRLGAAGGPWPSTACYSCSEQAFWAQHGRWPHGARRAWSACATTQGSGCIARPPGAYYGTNSASEVPKDRTAQGCLAPRGHINIHLRPCRPDKGPRPRRAALGPRQAAMCSGAVAGAPPALELGNTWGFQRIQSSCLRTFHVISP
jgi:hypothetical protein